MFWSDRVAGTRRRQAAHEVSNHGGRGLLHPVRPDPVTAAQSSPEASDSVAAASSPVARGPLGPRVETRPEGWRLVDRRGLLKAAGMAAVAAPATSLLAACGGGGSGGSGARSVRIGMVSPRTGSLRLYSEVDAHVVETMRTIFKDGIRVGRSTLPVEIFVRDGQSDRNRAAAAATDLIFTDQVDVVLVGGTSDNANPVSDACEANGVPCISTEAPWESWFYGRGGNVQAPFSWTYHFYWGMGDLRGAYTTMWGQLDVPRVVALLLPNDQDGATFSNGVFGLPALAQAGFRILSDVPPYSVGERDFSAQIQKIIDNDVEIVAGIPNPDDFAAFWRTLNDRNYLPKVVTMSKALSFERDVENLGATANGFTTEVSWSPKHQFRSYLTNRTAEELASEYVDQTGRPWAPSLGFTHALYEVLAQALVNVDSIDNARGIADAIARVKANTIVGTVTFGGAQNVPKNVGSIPLVGGQWRQQNNTFNLRVVANNGSNIAPDGPVEDLQTVQNR
ncbi:ABC-type branched-chain amino acid transport systems periplasmic component-like protein [Parafrankia sp. EAN1pec]|nr:ABC-type branched-chain amino acid transport systems periplasmic component-like protein [Frankia sp. EAN1pec]